MAGRSKNKKKVTFPAHAPEWSLLFLQTVGATGNVAAACKAAGVSRQTVYRHREQFPEFAKAWDDSLETALDKLEGVLWKEGANGHIRAIELVLKARRPMFREGHNSQVAVQVNNYMSPEEEQQQSDALMADVDAMTARMVEHRMIEEGDEEDS
jgi:hypothetical protein